MTDPLVNESFDKVYRRGRGGIDSALRSVQGRLKVAHSMASGLVMLLVKASVEVRRFVVLLLSLLSLGLLSSSLLVVMEVLCSSSRKPSQLSPRHFSILSTTSSSSRSRCGIIHRNRVYLELKQQKASEPIRSVFARSSRESSAILSARLLEHVRRPLQLTWRITAPLVSIRTYLVSNMTRRKEQDPSDVQ